jgi:hypothetical protein
MAGTVIRVIPKRTLDFSSVTSGSGQAEEIVLAQGIDISQWREVAMMVRTHANSFSGAIGTIDINAYLEGRTPEDPGILFAGSAAAGTYQITSSTSAGSYAVATCGSNTGAMLKITAKGTRTGSAAGQGIKADVSIDLSLKSS